MDYGVVTPQAGGQIKLSSGDSPLMLQGIDQLVQTVLIELCSAPSDFGGSGFAVILQGLSFGDEAALAVMGDRLRLAEENILRYQRDERLVSSERLRALDLIALRENSDGWEADIRLTAVSGEVVTRTIA